jgi:tetratricopeptide (TPR) repeat protein
MIIRLNLNSFFVSVNGNELGKYQEAIDAYKETIKIKPDFHMAYYNMGGAYNKLKEYQKNLNSFFVSVNGFLILS